MHRTTFYLFSDELRQRIKRTARKAGVSEAEVVRTVVHSYTEPLEDEPLWPTSAGIAKSGRVPADRLGEWKAEHWNRDW